MTEMKKKNPKSNSFERFIQNNRGRQVRNKKTKITL